MPRGRGGMVRRVTDDCDLTGEWDRAAGEVALAASMVQEAVIDCARGIRRGWIDPETLDIKQHVMTGKGYGVDYINYELALEASRFLRDDGWCGLVLALVAGLTGKRFDPHFFRSRARKLARGELVVSGGEGRKREMRERRGMARGARD
jgi:hypothetical protein